jgi:hypothetical protein
MKVSMAELSEFRDSLLVTERSVDVSSAYRHGRVANKPFMAIDKELV